MLITQRHNCKGFSFIELVITVAVVGILTAIAIPSYGGVQQQARIAAVDASAQNAYSQGVAADETGADLDSIARTMNAQSKGVSVEVSRSDGGVCAMAEWTDSSAQVPEKALGHCEGIEAPDEDDAPILRYRNLLSVWLVIDAPGLAGQQLTVRYSGSDDISTGHDVIVIPNGSTRVQVWNHETISSGELENLTLTLEASRPFLPKTVINLTSDDFVKVGTDVPIGEYDGHNYASRSYEAEARWSPTN